MKSTHVQVCDSHGERVINVYLEGEFFPDPANNSVSGRKADGTDLMIMGGHQSIILLATVDNNKKKRKV